MTITWTPLLDKLQEIEKTIEKVLDDELIQIGNRFLTEFDERVFEDGKNQDGKVRRGYKSKKYQEFKKNEFKIIPTSFVNLRRTEDMRKGIENASIKKKKATLSIGFRSEKLSKRLSYNEQRFGKIRGATEEEEKLIEKLVIEKLNKVLKE